MSSPSPPPVPESTTRPPIPPLPIHHSKFHLTTRLTIASGLMLVAVICALMILFMFIFHYCYHQRLLVVHGDIESSQVSGTAAEETSEEIPASVKMGFREIKTGEIGDCDGRKCAICIEGFGEEEICGVIENCGHFFHRDCINRWLRIERRCPLCRCFVGCS
ncbi:RING-H2 finger protein ATL1-like [Cucumis sativus]|uniref:RING-H2 finger protein ATL1-like n=1 Tax=Cucumis sativus TaxID=3659 RepID=UPI0012F4B8F4|nr:RING-H2 finger protein ATL1-like [Cucumis sativus]KAE8653253.1 hypothetical protein Csa_019970 [Cucumis sativus]